MVDSIPRKEKILMDMRNSFPKQLAAGAIAILLLVAGGRMMKAFNPQPDPPGIWGMIGITPSDTMRLNVVNMQFSGFPPGPCNVTLKFLNSDGEVLKQQAVSIKSTEAVSLDLTGIEAGGGFRTEVHPVLAVPSTEATGCSAVGSVEVFNTSSGETTILAHPIFIPVQQTSAAQPGQ
jgi:hypothetical protein